MSEPRTLHCLNCSKKMRPLFLAAHPWNPRAKVPTRCSSLHAADPMGFFCTMRFAMRYGIAAAARDLLKAAAKR